jgi:hypothetical protein
VNDPINLLFYAAVCGSLAVYAPTAGGRFARFVLGVVVGLIAATLLPLLKGLAGL